MYSVWPRSRGHAAEALGHGTQYGPRAWPQLHQGRGRENSQPEPTTSSLRREKEYFLRRLLTFFEISSDSEPGRLGRLRGLSETDF